MDLMIEINNLTKKVVDEEFLKSVAKTVLKGEEKKEAEVSLVLVGQGRIKGLNKKYRRKNQVTDVLAFGRDKKQKFAMPPGGKMELGEIVICLPVIKRNAKRFSSSFKKELALSLIHGILHLLGYNHLKSEAEDKKVEEAKASSSATELPKEAKVRKRMKSSFVFAAARVMKEKQQYYLSKILKNTC